MTAEIKQFVSRNEEVERAVQTAIMWRRKRQLKRRQERIGVAILWIVGFMVAASVGAWVGGHYG